MYKTINEEEDLIFQWVDEIEKGPIKKSVSFSEKVNLCLIETRKELNYAAFHMYMNSYNYSLIKKEFQNEVETFFRCYPEYKMKSRDEMTKNICEFIEQLKETKITS